MLDDIAMTTMTKQNVIHHFHPAYVRYILHGRESFEIPFFAGFG